MRWDQGGEGLRGTLPLRPRKACGPPCLASPLTWQCLPVIPLVPSSPVMAVSPQALERSLSCPHRALSLLFRITEKDPVLFLSGPGIDSFRSGPVRPQGHLLDPFPSNPEEGPLHSNLSPPPLCSIPFGPGKVHNPGSLPHSLQALWWLCTSMPQGRRVRDQLRAGGFLGSPYQWDSLYFRPGWKSAEIQVPVLGWQSMAWLDLGPRVPCPWAVRGSTRLSREPGTKCGGLSVAGMQPDSCSAQLCWGIRTLAHVAFPFLPAVIVALRALFLVLGIGMIALGRAGEVWSH